MRESAARGAPGLATDTLSNRNVATHPRLRRAKFTCCADPAFYSDPTIGATITAIGDDARTKIEYSHPILDAESGE